MAIECSAVAISRAKPTPWIASRIRSWASSVSVITSGSGPSSRIEPARTRSTPVLDALVHDPRGQHARLDGLRDPAQRGGSC